MTTQHTPGPWNVSPPCELSSRYSVYHNGPLVYVERGEDARLIAAAPDLLAALQDMVGAYQRHFDVMPVAWQTYDDIAREAIAKATGDSNHG